MATNNDVSKYVDLLKNCHNLILTGAPGTGKTYLARETAKKMIGTDGDEKEQIRFVQFHPSYDYTDFVEGLRPVKSSIRGNNLTIGFQRQDGLFKAFCKEALKNHTLEQRFNNLVEKIKRAEIKTLTQKNGKEINVSATVTNSICCKTKDSKSPTPYYVKYEHLQDIANTYPNKKALDEIRDINEAFPKATKIDNINASAYWATLNYIYNNISVPKYVFIIDEINRGELSKIFGELFFSIDPGYRGENGIVKTQYQNLIDENDITYPFREGFYVPENVYIIGTMNDIDRSVESMDFAIRRRFTWCEVTAEDSANAMLGDENDKRREYMNRVNNALNDLGFSEAYFVGAAYFKDLNDGKQTAEDLWNYSLKSLLFEYLRDREDTTEKLKELSKAYFNEPKEAEN